MAHQSAGADEQRSTAARACRHEFVCAEYGDLQDCVKFAGATADFLRQLRVFALLGASMSQQPRPTKLRWTLAVAISAVGCAQVPSHRTHDPIPAKTISGPIQVGGHRFEMHDSKECSACDERQRLEDYVEVAAPYIAGPFLHHSGETAYAAGQSTIQPPHSKFHPVPVRPVFETRASYLPPQPIGVHLVPVPDDGVHSMMNPMPQSDGTIMVMPTPNATSPERIESGVIDEDDTFLLPPPSN